MGVHSETYSDGSLECYKARRVAKGFTTYGIEYEETFAPVAKLNTIRILLSLAAYLNWRLYQSNIKNVSKWRVGRRGVYGWSTRLEKQLGWKICKLKKSMYELKQSPRTWFEKFSRSVMKQGYVQGQSDHTMFVKQQ